MTGKNSKRNLAIGDIHGAHIALQQCLDRCGFDYVNDTLITLGDICDGWSYVYESIEILLKCKNRIDIIGNHDAWFSEWLQTGIHPDYWDQGGSRTARSYLRNAGKDENEFAMNWGYTEYGQEKRMFTFDLNLEDIPPSHIAFFKNQHLYYLDDNKRLFVHGGFDKDFTLMENKRNHPSDFYWNRTLWNQALSVHEGERLNFIEEFSEIFIGHTQTTIWTRFKSLPGSLVLLPIQNDDCPPMHADIIWNIDTGAGSNGKLTIMDIDTHEYWQSDQVNTIYGDYKPRG